MSTSQVQSTAASPRVAWLLARELSTDRTTLALLGGGVALTTLIQTLLPPVISSASSTAGDADVAVQRLLLACLALLVLARVARWGVVLRGLSGHERSIIIVLCCVYLHFIGCALLAIPDALISAAAPRLDWRAAADSLALSSLAAILTHARLEPRRLGFLYLLLAWCVPALLSGSADKILPMLAPQLLAFGYISLGRAQQ
jgi:hypothetical protein